GLPAGRTGTVMPLCWHGFMRTCPESAIPATVQYLYGGTVTDVPCAYTVSAGAGVVVFRTAPATTAATATVTTSTPAAASATIVRVLGLVTDFLSLVGMRRRAGSPRGPPAWRVVAGCRPGRAAANAHGSSRRFAPIPVPAPRRPRRNPPT